MLSGQEQTDLEKLNEYSKYVKDMLVAREVGRENASIEVWGTGANGLAGELSLPCPYRRGDWSFTWPLCRDSGREAREAEAKLKQHLHDCLTAAEAKRIELQEKDASTESFENIFHKKGDRWEIAFKGPHFYLEDSRGVQFIACLLAQPNKYISALEIASLGSQHESHNQGSAYTGSSSPHDIADWDAVKDYNTTLNEIKEDLSKAEANGDEGRIQQLEKRKEDMIAQLGSVLKRDGQLRRFDDASEKARKSVTTEISRALEKIKAYNKTLYRYLDNSIRRGKNCIYLPTDEIDCQL